MELTVILPGLPPTLNHRTQPNGRGGRYVTPDAAAWHAGAALAIRTAGAGITWPPRTPLAVFVRLAAPDMLRWDTDNRVKALLDALAAGLNLDDRYVCELHVTKRRGPVAETTIRVLPAEEVAPD
jgi:Holliday junction resolvase RusA-like endonuclease